MRLFPLAINTRGHGLFPGAHNGPKKINLLASLLGATLALSVSSAEHGFSRKSVPYVLGCSCTGWLEISVHGGALSIRVIIIIIHGGHYSPFCTLSSLLLASGETPPEQRMLTNSRGTGKGGRPLSGGINGEHNGRGTPVRTMVRGIVQCTLLLLLPLCRIRTGRHCEQLEYNWPEKKRFLLPDYV